MLTNLRRALGMGRRRIEGLLFLVWAALLIPALLLALLLRVLNVKEAGCASSPGAGQELGCILKRWRRFIFYGLRDLRECWWVQFSYEKAPDIWHHVALLEVFSLANFARPVPARDPALPETARVLVVKLAHFGDALHIIPMLRALRAQKPRATIDLLVGPWCKGLGEKIPYVNHVTVYAPHYNLFNRGRTEGCRSGWREMLYLFELRKRRYDLLVSTSTTNLPECLLIHAVRPACWVGSTSPACGYVEHGVVLTEEYDSRAPESDRVAGLLRKVGLEPGDGCLEYWVESDDEAYAQGVWNGFGGAGSVRVVVAPGAGWPGKVWPAERFAAIVDTICEACDARVVLVGAPGEEALGEQIRHATKHAAADQIGQTTLDQLAAIIKSADLFIGNDSGPMHFAAAFGVPSVALFGPSVASKWGPRGPQHSVLQSSYDCEGCWSWHPRAVCVHERACMKALSVAGVKEAVMGQLGRIGSRD